MSKKHREEQAAIKLTQMLPDFSELHTIIKNYENKIDKESKFIFILDKILPIMNEYIFKSNWYIEQHVSFKKWHTWLLEKMEKVDFTVDPENGFVEEIILFFKQNAKGFLAEES